jgi:hypothetical protein
MRGGECKEHQSGCEPEPLQVVAPKINVHACPNYAAAVSIRSRVPVPLPEPIRVP